MSSGSSALSARIRVSVSCAHARRTLATWPKACTPASVRPAPCTLTGEPSNRASASSSSPWIDAPAAWRCHPTNRVPSYEIVSFKVRIVDAPRRRSGAGRGVLCRLVFPWLGSHPGAGLHDFLAGRTHRARVWLVGREGHVGQDRKSTRLNSSHGYTSYAVF